MKKLLAAALLAAALFGAYGTGYGASTATASGCAYFDVLSNLFYVPCYDGVNDHYAAVLEVVAMNPNVLQLKKIDKVSSTVHFGECSSFDILSNSVYIPCFKDDPNSWVTLRLINNNPVQFTIGDSGPNTAKLPYWVDGTWAGTVYQSDGTAKTVSIDVRRSVGTATVDYGSGCNGTLSLFDGSDYLNKLIFKETILSGSGTSGCQNNGTVVLTNISDAYITYSWFNSAGQLIMSSTLTKP